MSITRREFLRTGSFLMGSAAVAMASPFARQQAADRSRRCLVLIELNGGNDALNTLIPVRDSAYRLARPTLAIPESQALMLDGRVALHPAMHDLRDLFFHSKLAIIQGVGYPNPTRSHFRSAEIWQTADITGRSSETWLNRLRRHINAPPVLTCTDPHDPLPSSLPTTHYPLPTALPLFAEKIIQNEARLFSASIAGFDTHTRQAHAHAQLLATVSSAVGAFLRQLEAAGRDRDVLVMIHSEFGRRLKENTSAGTDHGTAGVLFFAGGSLRGGLYGQYPSLTDLDDGDLRFATDFRDCYAAVVENWFGVEADLVLPGHAGRVDFL